MPCAQHADHSCQQIDKLIAGAWLQQKARVDKKYKVSAHMEGGLTSKTTHTKENCVSEKTKSEQVGSYPARLE